jgi:hypothetical protein
MAKKYIFALMIRNSFILIFLLFIAACKKENALVSHVVQFSSNINNSLYYSLKINNIGPNDISTTYMVDGNSDIELTLFKAGGDTTSVDSRDSLWVRGGILVDGELVSSYAGYRDATLTYHIE